MPSYTGTKLIHLDTVTSTNDYAKALVQNQNVPEGTVVLADQQTQGKGQRGASWVAEKGKNLTFSMVYYPSFIQAQHQFLLNKVVTLGIVYGLKNILPNHGLSIKWPNDVYYEHYKLGGILLENTLEGNYLSSSIIGIGLNVNQTDFNQLPKATSFKLVTNHTHQLKDLLQIIGGEIEDKYFKLKSSLDTQALKDEYEQHLFLKDQWRTLKDGKHNPFKGKIKGVDELGHLMVELAGDGTIQRFGFKEIQFD